MHPMQNLQLIHHSNQFGSPEKWGKIIAPFLLAGAMLMVLLGVVSPPANAAGELIIEKYASASQIYAGDTVQYTIVVTNATSTDYLVTISDTIPSGVEVVSNPNGASINGSVLRWLEIGLPRNQSKQVSFTARITKSGTIVNSSYSADAGGGINGTGSPVPVEVLPGPPQRVNIEALPTSATVGPGSTVNLTITVADQYGNPVTSNTGVQINFSLGSIDGKSPGQFVSGVTDSNGQLLKVLNVLTVAGTARITATAAGLGQGSISVPFNPDVPAALNVTANPTSISTVGTQKSTITAQVVDQYNNPLSSLPITFTTSLGLFNSPPGSSSVVVNTVSGQASAQLSGSVAGTATITVTAAGLTPKTTQVYLAPGPAAQMRFEPPPDTEISIVANGVSTATMALLLRDANGNLTQTPTEVTLSTTLGRLNGGGSTYQETTTTGQVLITLTSITRTGTAKITASAGGLTTDRTVNFVPGNPASIVLEVTPPAIVADNAATAQLKASVYDALGNSVNNQAITYTFTVGHGTLDSSGGTSDNGYLVRTLRSDTTLDPAVPITVTVSKLANPVTGTIAFVVGPPDHVAVVASATSITVANSVGLQLTLHDKSNHVVPNVPLTVTSSLGTISPGATNTTNSGGQVSLQLLSTRAGVATLSAASFNGAVTVTGHNPITFTADVPTEAVLQALPTSIVADGLTTAVITVTVTDIYANPVAGVNPTLTTTEGTLSGSGVTGSDGKTTRTLRSTTAITTAVIDVDGLNASPISVKFVTGPVYSVTMTASPDTAYVEGEGSPDQITANFSVTDKVGHPLVNQTVSLTSTFGTRMQIACNTAIDGRAVTNAYGQFSCNLQSTKSGTPDIYVDSIKAVAASFQFLPGPEVRVEVYPAHTSFSTALELAAGTPYQFTAMAFDTYNNPISSITNFSWEVQPSAPSTDFRLGGGTISNGLFVGQKTGYVMIIAAVGGSIGYSYVEVLPGPPTQAQLTATPKTTPIEPPSGGVIQLSIKVMDSYGNAIGSGFVPVVTTTIGAAEGTGSTNSSGVAASSIRSTVAGQATLNVTNLLTVTGDTIVNFTVGKPSKVRVISSKTRLHANGTETADLTVQALDYYNNPVAAGYRLNIVTPPGTVSCPLGYYTNASGVVSCILTSATTEATVNFNQITYNGVPLTLTPDSTTVEFYVGLLRDIVFSPTLPITVTAGVPVTVTANGYDAERAQVPPAQLTYSWSQYPPEHGLISPADARIITFLGQTQGTSRIQVILTDLHYGGDPPPARSVLVTINVIPAPPSQANITVSPAAIEANGVSTSTITLSNLRDSFDNDASLGDVITLTVGSRVFTGAVTTGDVVQVVVPSTQVAGTYPITAANSAGNIIDLTGTAQLVLEPGPAARAAITSATPPAVVADGASLSTLVIRVTDQYGNTVPQGLALTVTGGLNTIISGSGNTDSQGQITRTLQAGLLVGTAVLTLDTGSSPFTTTNGLPLITGPAVSATLTASSSTLVAGGSPITMTFYLEDAWQHPVSGWVITPTLAPLYGLFTGSSASNAAGQVIQTLTPLTTSGQATVTVSGLAVSGDTSLIINPNVAKIARVEANPKQLMVTESTALTITITDAYGNKILPAAIATTSLLTGTFNGGSASTITQTTNAAAQFTATLTTRNSGTDTLAFVGPAGALTLHPNSNILAFTPDELIVVALDQTQPITVVAGVPIQIMASSLDRYGNIIDPWAPMTYVWKQTSKLAEPGYGAFTSLDPNSRMVRFTPRIVGMNKLNAANGVFESNPLTVTVIAGPPQQAAVLTPPASVEANDVSTTTITLANLRDQYGNAVADGHVITVTVDTKSARGVVSGGLANVVITATRKAGNHPIVATSSAGLMSLAGYSTVKFYAGLPEKAQVQVIPATVIPIDTVTATMVMTIYDRYDNLVENGQVITVTVDKATVGGTTTTLNGRISRTLTPTALGSATVSAAGSPGSQGAIFLVGDTELLFIPGAPTYANITANPAKVIGDGQSGSSLAVVLKDAVGFPSGSSGTAVITSSRGTVVPTTTTVVNGSFGATFYAERGVGPVKLFVTFEGKPMLSTGDSLEMVPDVPYTATLKATPTTVRVDTTDKSTLVWTLVDQWSNPITNTTPVSVTPSIGSLAPAQMNSVGNVVTMTFTPDTVAGPVTFTVRAPQGSSPLRVSGNTLTVLPGPIYSVTITAPPAPVEVVAGQSVNFTAVGIDKFGNQTSTGPFEWRKLFGGIGGGSGIGNGILQNGVFTGTVSGILGVQAYTGTIYSEGKSVTVRPGPIASAIVSASPITIPVGGFASQLVITLRDAYGNLVADGLSPLVTTNLGTLSGSGLTSNGLITRTLYSGSFSGRPDIFVNGLKASGDSIFFQPRAWADATPSTLVANNTDTAQVRVRLLDQNGLPISQLPQTITATIGVLDYTACTQDADYVMVCSLRATTQVGTGYIYVDGFPAQGVITFTTGAASLALIETASPVVAVSGLSTSSLKITVQDQFGHIKTDDNSSLNVTSSIGTIGGVQPTVNGVTYRTFTGGSTPGIATLGVTGLTVTGTQFIQVSGVTATIQAAKSYLTADGQNTTVLTITLQDSAGKTATFINHSLIVNSSLGTVGGSWPTVKGVTTRTLTAGQTEGNAAITVQFDDTAAAGLGAQAFINLPVSGQTSLTFYHPVARVTASPEVLIANGSSQTQLTVVLEDVFGNPLTYSTAPLTVTTSAGTISGFQATVGGTTRRTLTAASSSAMAAIGVSGLNGLTVAGSAKVQFVGTSIIDGNFASGTLNNWIVGSGPVTATKVYTTLLKLSDYVDGIPVSPPGSGYMARLGASTQDKTGHDLSETWLQQSVYVTPTGISQLQFKYRILSYDVAVGSASKGSLEYDPFKVFINGNQVLRDGYIYDEAWKDWYYTNPASPKDMPNEFEAGNQWRKGILDLSKYAGKIATIEFTVSNAIMPADNTWVYVYDIKVVHANAPSYKVYLPIIIR